MGARLQGAHESLDVMSRVEWSCPDGASSRWTPVAMAPTHIVVHHSAMWPNIGPECIREIWRFHAIEREWGDIGYHYLIDAAGNVFRGRAECSVAAHESIGAHVKLHNGASIGICTLGNFSERWPTDAALATLRRALTALCATWAIDPLGVGALGESQGARISGHRDWTPTTECPGHHLYALLDGLRNATALHLVRARGAS